MPAMTKLGISVVRRTLFWLSFVLIILGILLAITAQNLLLTVLGILIALVSAALMVSLLSSSRRDRRTDDNSDGEQ